VKKNIYYFLIPFLAILALKYFDSFSVSEQITGVESSEILISHKNIPEIIDFNFHVKPIISDKCFACHGPDEKERAANLRLDTEDGLYQLTEELSSYVVDKKSPEKSEMLNRIFHDNPSIVMPPPESNLVLSDYEKEILNKWILQGGKWKKHWSYNKPIKPQLPPVKNKSWINNDIDYFTLKNIEANGLNISSVEDKEILIRRLFFDLIGLAPSFEEID
jgi:hypothetical protein